MWREKEDGDWPDGYQLCLVGSRLGVVRRKMPSYKAIPPGRESTRHYGVVVEHFRYNFCLDLLAVCLYGGRRSLYIQLLLEDRSICEMHHPWATCLGFALLTANSAAAIRRSSQAGDAAAAWFVVASYLGLLLLFLCLRRVEITAPPPANNLLVTRDRAKAGVWVLTTLLTAMFSWRVSSLMPWAVAGVVWLVAAASAVLGGFYAFFLLPRHPAESSVTHGPGPVTKD